MIVSSACDAKLRQIWYIDDGLYLFINNVFYRLCRYKYINIWCNIYIVSASSDYTEYKAYAHLASGLSVGLSALGAGMAIGIVGDAGVRANGQQPRLFVGMILILIFAEALGLYGLIVAIILSQQS